MTLAELEEKIKMEIERFERNFKPVERKIEVNKRNIASFIDHTLLKPFILPEDIDRICEEAVSKGFYSVCVNPAFVSQAKKKLKKTAVKVCTVVGFPLGANTINMKVKEAVEAMENGAEEFDMVINISKLKAKEWDYVFNEIKSVVEAVKGNSVKVIIEACYLNQEEKIAATTIVRESGAHFVKTSTGFGIGGATLEDVSLMYFVANNKIKVKAAGGIRTFGDAVKMIKAGADRIGTSSGMRIVQ